MARDENGRFTSGNPGRRKGSKNKLPRKAKAFLIDFLENEQEKAEKDWLELSPWERWQLRARLFEYVTPKMSRSEASLDVSKLSPQEVDLLLSRALEMANKDDY